MSAADWKAVTDIQSGSSTILFPFRQSPPPPSEHKFAPLVDAIIDARAAHPNTTLAELWP